MGQVYCGKLIEAVDNMNFQMASITVTYRDGRVAQLENIYIRGSKIRFLILPGRSLSHSCWCQFLCFPSSDMLTNAPMFKNMKNIINSQCAFNMKDTQVCVRADLLPHHHNFPVLPHVTLLAQGLQHIFSASVRSKTVYHK